MKILLRVLLGLFFSACAALADADLASVPFVIGQQQFKAGDSLVIEQVLASSPKLGVGDKVFVRGRYRVASTAKARLGLFVTHRSTTDGDPVASSQMVPVESPAGFFELACEVTHAGDLHVSFYPASHGESFGGVYFSSAPPEKMK